LLMKLRMLAGLYAAGSSSSRPSKSLRSGVGLLLRCVVAVVLFSGAFSLALNRPPGPRGGSVRLLDDIGVLSYVCFVVLVLVVFCLGAFAWRGSEAALVTTLGGGAAPLWVWFTGKD